MRTPKDTKGRATPGSKRPPRGSPGGSPKSRWSSRRLSAKKTVYRDTGARACTFRGSARHKRALSRMQSVIAAGKAQAAAERAAAEGTAPPHAAVKKRPAAAARAAASGNAEKKPRAADPPQTPPRSSRPATTSAAASSPQATGQHITLFAAGGLASRNARGPFRAPSPSQQSNLSSCCRRAFFLQISCTICSRPNQTICLRRHCPLEPPIVQFSVFPLSRAPNAVQPRVNFHPAHGNPQPYSPMVKEMCVCVCLCLCLCLRVGRLAIVWCDIQSFRPFWQNASL